MESKGSLVRRIAKNLSFGSLAVLVSKLSQLVLFVLIARWLGAEGLGLYSYAISMVLVVGVLSDLGISQYVVSQVAATGQNTAWYLNNTFTLRFGLSSLGLLIILALPSVLNLSASSRNLLWLFGLGNFFINLTLGWRWIFQAQQKLQYEALLLVVFGLIYSLCGTLFLIWKKDLVWIGASYLIGGVIFLALCYYLVATRFVRPRFEIDWSAGRQILAGAFPMTLYVLFICSYYYADTILLSHLQGEGATGIYNASNRIIQQMRQIPALLAPAFLPAMTQLAIFNPQRFAALLRKGLFYLFALILPVVVIICLSAPYLLPLVYGSGFSASVGVLQIQIWAAILEILNGFVFLSLMAQKKYKTLALLCGIGALVNVSLNLILIPLISVRGAAVAILASETVVFGGTILVLQRLTAFSLKTLATSYLVPVLSGLAMLPFWLVFSGWNWLAGAAISALIYSLTLVALKGIPSEDWVIWKGLLRRDNASAWVEVGG